MTDNGDPAQESPAQWSYDQAPFPPAAGPDRSAGSEHLADHGGGSIFGTSRTGAIPPIGAPGEPTADAAAYDPAQYGAPVYGSAPHDDSEFGAGEFGAGEFGAAVSGAGESGAGESGAGESGAGESGAGESGAGESGAGESGAGEQNGAAPEGLGRHSQFGSDGFPDVHYYAHPGADPSRPVAPAGSDGAAGSHEPAGSQDPGPDELNGSVAAGDEQPAVQAGSWPSAEFGSPFGLPPAAPFYAEAGQHQPAQPDHGQQDQIQHDQAQYAQSQYAQPQYAQPQYAQPQYAQPQYAQPQYNQSSQHPADQYAPNQYAPEQPAQGQHAQGHSDQNQYGQDQHDQNQHDQNQHDQNQHDQNQHNPNPYQYDQNQYARDAYGRDAYGRDAYGRDAYGREVDPNSAQGPYPGQAGAPAQQQGQPQPGPQPQHGQSQPGQQQPGQQQPGQAQKSQPSSYPTPAPAPEAAKPSGPLPTAAQPRPESLLVPSHRATATQAAQSGWQGRVRRMTAGAIKPSPSAQELSDRKDSQDIQRTFSRPMTIVVVQPKGGAGKTPATIALASALGAHRGGYVVGWDDNETRGTLAVRVDNADNQTTTVWDLLRDLGTFERTNARVGDLSHYVRSQGAAQFDALVSDDSPGNMAQIGESEFKRIHTVLQRFYRQIVVDTGNNVRSPNWQAAVNSADQIVVVSTYQRDVGYSGSWVLDHLIETGRAELAAGAITVLSAADPRPDPAVRRELIEHFGARTRAVVEIPYDPLVALGGPIEWVRLKPETRRAWTHAGAGVVTALAAHDEAERLATRTKG